MRKILSASGWGWVLVPVCRGGMDPMVVPSDWALGAGDESGWASACRLGWAMGGMDGVWFGLGAVDAVLMVCHVSVI